METNTSTIHPVYTDFRLYNRNIRIFQVFHPSVHNPKNIKHEYTDRKTCAQNEKTGQKRASFVHAKLTFAVVVGGGGVELCTVLQKYIMCCKAQSRTTIFISTVCHAHLLNISRIRNFAVRKHSYILQCIIRPRVR